jgi:hypothetical protein
MYYHCRPLKYVEYGKVYPPPIELADFLQSAYIWLGNYCNFCPQIWLSRSHLSITGYKNDRILKKRQYVRQKRNTTKDSNNSVLFGFDIIKGFPVSYRYWELIMIFMYDKKTLEEQNKELVKEISDMARDNSLEDEEIIAWRRCNNNLDLFLKKYLFVEEDQVVVPSLNLKAAKQIICHDEKQKKALRKMGFIEDRIKIRNIKGHNF